jgi:hypothetical protein
MAIWKPKANATIIKNVLINASFFKRAPKNLTIDQLISFQMRVDGGTDPIRLMMAVRV